MESLRVKKSLEIEVNDNGDVIFIPVEDVQFLDGLPTIEDAVRNVVGDRSGGTLNVNLNYDGETFARLFLQDFLNEMNRQGYDIDVLGGMS